MSHDASQRSKCRGALLLLLTVAGENGIYVDLFGLLGTGKSLLLRAIISALRKKHVKKPEVISVTASTGMAASNIGGMFD